VFRWIVGGLLIAAVIVFIAAVYPNENGSERGPALMDERTLPGLAFPSLQGPAVDLSALHGQPALVNVWATWCGPCRREMPALAMLARRFNGRLVVIAVDQGEDPEVVKAYVKQFGVGFPVAVDKDQRLGTALHLVGMPSSFFVDRQGVVRDAIDGEMSYAMMSEKAQRLLADSTERN